MSQTQNANSPQEAPFDPNALGYAGYVNFQWFFMFRIIPDPVIPDYFEVTAVMVINGTSEYALTSLPVHATYGTVVIPFPSLQQYAGSGGVSPVEIYQGKATSIVNQVEQLDNSINITLSRPLLTSSSGRPGISLNACTINQEWLIGARNILLVEFPGPDTGA